MSEVTPSLIDRALGGDRGAVRVVIDVATPVIQSRVARALVRRRRAAGQRDVRQEVEDLTQSVFVALFSGDGRALRQWDPSRGLDFPGFVGLLATREVASILRSRRQSPWTEDPTDDELLELDPDGASGPEVETGARETLRAILTGLRERLTDRGLEMFQLLLVDGRSAEDVCVLMSMSPDAVYAWRSRLGRMAREIAAEISSEKPPWPRKS